MAEQQPDGAATIVSSDSEALILVDAEDREIGFRDKGRCHDGEGILHRAFSLFIFNAAGELLLQQRAADKRLWPGYWANSCCSHPRRGETLEIATGRRLAEELGMRATLEHVYKFQYHARYGELGSERELCHVFVGRSDDTVRANPTEIAAWRWVTPAALDAEMAAHPERFTPWLQMEWQRLRGEFAARLPEPASA